VPPKVFISYASEDRSFARDLGTRLRAHGIDAWLDAWEILPGDSLIDKIFEEGLKNAQAVIVILSKSSVDKPWVREELNTAMVKRINGLSKLIPIILDDCEIPQALHSTVWIRIGDPSHYDVELEQITRAVFDFRDKPAVGEPPTYASTVIDAIPGLTKIDTLVFRLVGELALKNETGRVHDVNLFEQTRSQDLSDDAAFESLQMLESRVFLEIKRVHNTSKLFHSVKMTSYGMEEFARSYVAGYESLPKDVAHQIVNLNQINSRDIAKTLDRPILLLNHIIESFKRQGLFKVVVSHTGDYNLHIFQVSPLLKRILD
jgi:TIR domain